MDLDPNTGLPIEPNGEPSEVSPEAANDSEPVVADRSPAAIEGIAPNAADEFIRFKRSHVYVALLPLTFVAGLAAGFLFWGRGAPEANTPAAAVPEPAPRTSQTRLDISVDDDPSLGPEDAPITIVEFSDFNCRFCQRFHIETFPALMQAYPDQIRFVYRDFPILSEESFLAAQAAECANEQGAYWEFHDALFSGGLGLSLETYMIYAERLGLDSEALNRCVQEGRYASEVQADARYAAGLGITGTPTFFINGIPLVGAQPLQQFLTIIEDELN